jgi:NitT/TauT family transport system ATP-binding protein
MLSLQAEELSKTFLGNPSHGQSNNETVVFENLSFKLQAGQICALYGPNGCGKSTLLDILAGNLKPDSGNVRFAEESCRVGFVWQDFRSAIFPWLSVAQNIALAEAISGQPKTVVNDKASAALTRLGVAVPLHSRAGDLSGGQKQIMCLARLIASDPSIIFLDEPFAAIDERNKHIVSENLRHWIVENAKAAAIVMHDLDEAILISDRILILSNKPMVPLQDIAIQLANRVSPDTLISREFGLVRQQALGAVSQWRS